MPAQHFLHRAAEVDVDDVETGRHQLPPPGQSRLDRPPSTARRPDAPRRSRTDSVAHGALLTPAPRSDRASPRTACTAPRAAARSPASPSRCSPTAPPARPESRARWVPKRSVALRERHGSPILSPRSKIGQRIALRTQLARAFEAGQSFAARAAASGTSSAATRSKTSAH